jgi:cytochrome c-type biogenesis protein
VTTFGPATYGLALIAGMLSTLSPCVLPLIPVLVASAADAHPGGVWALGAGLAVTFSVVGIFIATLGASLGLDPETFRVLGAVILALFGAVLISQSLQSRFAAVTAGVGGFGHHMLAGIKTNGLRGQFAVGALLGVVWSPCVGPTLGAATTVASQGQHLGAIAVLMFVFGLGAATPLVALGSLSRVTLQRVREVLVKSGQWGRQILGVTLLVVSLLIFTKADKSIESWVLDHAPAWLAEASVRF